MELYTTHHSTYYYSYSSMLWCKDSSSRTLLKAAKEQEWYNALDMEGKIPISTTLLNTITNPAFWRGGLV